MDNFISLSEEKYHLFFSILKRSHKNKFDGIVSRLISSYRVTMENCSLLYKEEHEDHLHIRIDDFLKTPWVEETMTQSLKLYEEEHISDNSESETSVKEIPLERSAAFIVNVHLFIKWLSNNITELDPEGEKKIILEIMNKWNFDYVAALAFELRKIIRGIDSFNNEIKNKILSTETFLPRQFWPNRWIVHIRWKPKHIPGMFWKLENIEYVSFEKSWNESQKHLDCLPYQVGRLRKLRFLNLKGNRLQKLPISLYFCEKLERLDLRDNSFRTLPIFLKDMPNLEFIFRSQNYLECSVNVGVDTECLEPEEAPKMQRLVELAAKSVCKQRLPEQFVVNDLNIPKELKSYLQYVCSSLKYCYGCKRGLDSTETVIQCSSTVGDFVGNCNVKTFCHSCASCTEDVLAYLTKISWTNTSHNERAFSYSNGDVDLSYLHKRNCSYCKSAVAQFLRFIKIYR